MQWEVVIGIETHAQLTTESKIFSGASTAFGAEPNSQASAVDLALPGTLPVLNRGAVERAIRFGIAISATVAGHSIFARKNFIPICRRATRLASTKLRWSRGAH
jgi:aspartyl-tRNA(Asn)/glutamyl-tRNA(Gln) amidotransferase subunit B